MRRITLALMALGLCGPVHGEPLRVCVTVPDLGDLVRQVGGDEVSVTVFVKGAEDPHFVEAKPGFIRALSRADLYVEVGMELEVGWAPVLLQNARNARILPGQPGHLDASTAITPLEVPQGTVDRAMGDVHARGNPHYLLDPENGLAVARLIRDRLSALRPAAAAGFSERYDALAARMAAAMAKWRDELAPARGAKVLVDHNLWPYFAARYGLVVAGHLEPKPGVPPSTRHLADAIALAGREKVRALLASPYFDRRHAEFVKSRTGVPVVELAHQVGGRPGTDTYEALIAHNVRKLAEAMR